MSNGLMVEHSSTDNIPVVIIGAGLAGLVAGVHLAERGVPPMILESDYLWAGGRLSGGEPDTFNYQGQEWAFKPEHSVHALWGGYHNMRAMIDRFLPEMQLQPSFGEEWINRWGREVRTLEAGNAIRSRWLPAPFHYLQLLFHPEIWATITPLDFLSLPGFLVSVLLTVGYDPIREKSALDGLMMREYFRGWTPNLKATFVGVGQNLMAAHMDETDFSAYVAAMRFYTMMRRDTWNMEYFPADSNTCLIQPLIDKITAHNGLVQGGTTAKRLEKLEHGWRVIIEDSLAGGLRTLYADHVILATNAPSAKRLLCNSPDTEQHAQNIIFPDGIRNIVIRLWFDKSPREGTQGGMLTGDFTADNFFWLHRLYDDFREWHKSTGGSAIELHFYAKRSFLEMPDHNLLITAVNEVHYAFPELKGHFTNGVIRRNSGVHTRFRVPTDDSLWVNTPWENIYACGDWVGYDTPSFWMERASTTGIAAANRVLSNIGLEPYPLITPKPAEPLARAMEQLIRIGRMLLGRPIRAVYRIFRRK
jgi:carotenoid phi-ring synthase / carotenoid chi-ring synthase